MSATGTGEAFMRGLAQAAQQVILEKLPQQYGGRGGLIGIDAQGNIVLPFNTEGMYRGHVRVGAAPQVAIYADEN
ncbi:MAG: isoaspartyl peptidase/L-asparaginase [Burkholderiales bacterium]|nr:isoaspartyl peptidase/L-asparaginase [Burkholderiales bacterium]